MIYIVIGVSGVGKTTLGLMLSEKLNATFLDADDFHPPANIQKMSEGTPLNDADRKPWLEKINTHLIQNSDSKNIVLCCSALKESYRQTLSKDVEIETEWVYLYGSFDLLKKRMENRKHFMPSELLQSQFATLEVPNYGLHFDVIEKPEKIVTQIMDGIANNIKSDIGLIGLGVMGKSLSRNMVNNGFNVSVYNRHVDEVEVDVAKNFVATYPELSKTQAFDELEGFVKSLNSPRIVFLMVNAGSAVDQVIASILPHLEANDIIIDGGNSHYKDTEKRYHELLDKKIQYIGTGVSGGEEGALKGPSIMPGGSLKAYNHVSQILNTIAAKDKKGNPCCGYIGSGGAGHFVKMVHNGIEYGEMQLIAEVYGILRLHMNKSPEDISALFTQWLETDCQSYLLEITRDILLKKENDNYLIDIILDKAGNKGTGSWTTIAACELGVAIPTLTAALFARYQSSQHTLRQKTSDLYQRAQSTPLEIDLEELRLAFQQARIINHHQGFDLIAAASEKYNWNINVNALCQIWTNGCIIRSHLMEQLAEDKAVNFDLLLNPNVNGIFLNQADVLNNIISTISTSNISAPCFFSCLSYLNAYTEKESLANIIQAQRDYFGAHTYERRDTPGGQKFHTEWL